MVLAFELLLFLFFAKQTLDSECYAFGDDFSDGVTISLRTFVRAARRFSWRPEKCGFPQPLTTRHRRRTRGRRALFWDPMDLRHLGAVGERFAIAGNAGPVGIDHHGITEGSQRPPLRRD